MSARRGLTSYQRVVPATESIPADQLNRLFMELLERLDLCVVVEETPDYVGYSLEKKAEASGKT